ncbi:quinol monooxygenase YgiN [Agrobacterium fabrum]|nr:quinol monooxygenase YgiN [Agrobacterium fabrum]
MSGMNNKAVAVRLSGFLRCLSEDDVELVRQHLPDHIRLTRAEPGCISFEVSQTDDPLVWRVEELFADRPAFDFSSAADAGICLVYGDLRHSARL